MLAKNMPTKFAFALIADESDWSWIPNAPNTTTIEWGSQIMIGNYDPTMWIDNSTTNSTLTISTIAGAQDWKFELEQFAFGSANYSAAENETYQNYVNLTTDDYKYGLFSIAHPGIGLPSPLFTPFTEMLQNITNNIWACGNKDG